MKRQPIVRERRTPAGRDAYGDPVAGTVDHLTIDGCVVYPRDEAGEGADRGRTGVIVGLGVIAPLGADLVHEDRVQIGDTWDPDPEAETWEVEGEPGVWEGTRVGGVEIALKRAKG